MFILHAILHGKVMLFYAIEIKVQVIRSSFITGFILLSKLSYNCIIRVYCILNGVTVLFLFHNKSYRLKHVVL